MRAKNWLVLFPVFLLAGCGGGGTGGSGSTPQASVQEYEVWLQETLDSQRQIVTDDSAAFVAFDSITPTNVVTPLIGWVYTADDPAPEQLKRFSASPGLVDALIEANTNVLTSPGRSFQLAGTYSSSSSIGLDIPIISALINFAASKSVKGGFTIAISYESGQTHWFGRQGLKKLFESANLSQDFLDQVQDGQVKMFQGMLALHNLDIQLQRQSSSDGSFKLGETFTDGKSGISLKVESLGNSSSSGSVGLRVAEDLFVGVHLKVLTPEDIGLLTTQGSTELSGVPFSYGSAVNPRTRKGYHWLRNDGNFSVSGVRYVPLARLGEGSQRLYIQLAEQKLTRLDPGRLTTVPVDFSTSQLPGEITASDPMIINWAYIGFGTFGNWSAGVFEGEIIDETKFPGPLATTLVRGFVAGDGTTLFLDEGGIPIVEGRIFNDYYQLTSPLLKQSEPITGNVRWSEGVHSIALDTLRDLYYRNDPPYDWSS